jgi:hypothetical protein
VASMVFQEKKNACFELGVFLYFSYNTLVIIDLFGVF